MFRRKRRVKPDQIELALSVARLQDQIKARNCSSCITDSDTIRFCVEHAGVRGPDGVPGPPGVPGPMGFIYEEIKRR